MQYFLLLLVLVSTMWISTGFHSNSVLVKNSLQARSNLVMRERKCDITGKRQNSKCMAVSKSNVHTHRVQHVNLQTKKLWWEEGKKYVRVRIATKTYRTILKNGLHATAKKYGINLNKYSVSFGDGPTRVPPPEYVSTFTGEIELRPRYAAYLQQEIKYNPTQVAEHLLPGYVAKVAPITSKIDFKRKGKEEEAAGDFDEDE